MSLISRGPRDLGGAELRGPFREQPRDGLHVRRAVRPQGRQHLPVKENRFVSCLKKVLFRATINSVQRFGINKILIESAVLLVVTDSIDEVDVS